MFFFDCSLLIQLQRWLSVTEKYMLMTPKDGAKTQTYLAASPEIDEKGYA
jgi:hypothetical protein